MTKIIYSSIILIALCMSCSSKMELQPVYYLGDSHFSRMDDNWWLPQALNHNLAVPGTRLNEIAPQYQGLNDSTALCFIQIGTNSIKGAYNSGVNQDLLMDSLIDGYATLLKDVSVIFRKTYILSVIPVSQHFDESVTPELGHFYFAVNENIDSLSNLINNVEFLNVNQVLMDPETYLLEDDMTIDFLHLNNFGYQLMTGVMRKKINEYEN